MKKVIFSAAALMIGGVAFAQSGSGQVTPDPVVMGPEETVMNKSANLEANAAETYQLGNDNKVRVAQAGTRQTAYVSQDNGSTGVGANLAMIQQTGEVGSTSGVANAAEIKQSGEANAAMVGQQGDLNAAVAYQGQSSFNSAGDDSSTGNVSLIQQGNAGQAQYNAAETNQNGTDNFIALTQTSDRNSAYAEQVGEENKLVLNQSSSPDLSDGHLAISVQLGDENEGVIDQSGDAGGEDTGYNNAQLRQDGTGNISKQIQVTTAEQGNIGETAVVAQGWNNITIGGALDNDGQANVNGDNTVKGQLEDLGGTIEPNAAHTQSFGGIAVQMQTGEGNASEIHQFGAAAPTESNEAQQNQSGDNNDALIVQNTRGSSVGGGNFAFQDQSDSDNVAGISQIGVGHKAQQLQSGEGNQAFMVQKGTRNKASSLQSGDNSRLESIQGGIENSIVITQEDGQSAWVEQNNAEGGPVGGNQAGIIQTGPNGSLPADLGDATLNCNFQELMPTPAIETSSFTINDLCPDCN